MDIKRVGDAGVHTVEGAVAGSRAARLTAEREEQVRQYNATKNEIQSQNKSISSFGSKFSAGKSGAEAELRSRTVGLLSADAYDAAVRSATAHATETTEEEKSCPSVRNITSDIKIQQLPQHDKKRPRQSVLSFSMEDGADGEDIAIENIPLKRSAFTSGSIKKDPTADTAFLPDRERDAAIEQAKVDLRKEWLAQQEEIKLQKLEVIYSYWDGSGHRKAITLTKGTTIEQFLVQVKEQCMVEFRDLRSCSADSLMYIKEDLIIPHDLSFYDLIVTKARGKSGPLFHFDVHDDVRLKSDATVEKDESHPGKICQRSWYERNKHIFPASRWEVYDPAVKRDSTYTIHGK